MTEGSAQGRALRPLWLLTSGAALAATATSFLVVPGEPWIRVLLAALGLSACVAALSGRQKSTAALWFFAGFAVVGGRGLALAADRAAWVPLVSTPDLTLRARVVATEGWTDSRWGVRTRAKVLGATVRDRPIRISSRCRIEVRGPVVGDGPAAPGEIIDILARPAGSATNPLLVVPSPRLLKPTGRTLPVPRLRNRLAKALMSAAGTDVRAIRTAEVAAALALGRRDLIPPERRDFWRRSGFAHLLAVSGLHVGIVGGTVWLIAALLGANPRTARLVALAAIPSYAVLAGAPPSAMRAALMGVIYLGARFLGRAVLPMAAVLLAALTLLVANPSMITEAGFQLTVVITAALIRWVPPIASALRGPLWLTGAVAVPLVAQTAAAPIVAWHFRSLIPGALVSNLLALPVLAPTVLAAVAATGLAPLWPGGASWILWLIRQLTGLLVLSGEAARAVELIAPRPSPAALVLLAILGLLALQTGRRAPRAAAAWVVAIALLNLALILPSKDASPGASVLPVGDGAAILLESGSDAILVDAGRYTRQAAVLTADSGHRRLRALVASHTDEDHIGGAVQVVRTLAVERLVVPSWFGSTTEGVPLLRAARAAGTRVVPVSRGTALSLGAARLVALWPPGADPPRLENERSLVARIDLGPGSVLLTSDIGRSTERRLGASTRLGCDVLVVPHHGGRGSSSPCLLDGARPAIALIPASPGNTHGHPHDEVLERLFSRGITVRKPTRNAAAGARWNEKRWVAYP